MCEINTKEFYWRQEKKARQLKKIVNLFSGDTDNKNKF